MAAIATNAFVLGALITSSPELSEVQRRRASNARAAFAAAVQDPLLKDPFQSPLELACLIVAEERCADPFLRPSHVAEGIRSSVEQIITPASKRITLSRQIAEVGSEAIATAVTNTLFGSHGSPDDEDAGAFFALESNTESDELLYLDTVLARRRGVPLATSLIACEACAQLGLPMVGLRSPTALLLAPADGTPFVLDCFSGGGIRSDDDAAAALSERLAGDLPVTGSALPQASSPTPAGGQRQLAAMRRAPMTALQWGAEVLRALKEVHEESGDVVRLLGACDRLRMIGAHSRLAVSNDEMRECSGQLALCIHRLGWVQRRNEARALLHGVLRSHDEMGNDPGEPARVQSLLDDPWFAEA